MTTWISDKLLGLRRVFFGGQQLPERGALEFTGDGVTVEDDSSNKRTKVTIAGGGFSLSESLPTQPGELYIDADGRLWGWSPRYSIASPLLAEVDFPVVWGDALDDPATTMGPRALSTPNPLSEAMVIEGAVYVPRNALVADNTNYAQLVINRTSSSTGARTQIMRLSTTASAGNWTAHVPVNIPVIGSPPAILPAGEYLTWEINIGGGSGVEVPAGRLFARLVRAAAMGL